ncbi:MAG: GNAT family N-acetyltransferase [Candidatus Parabeggiatoa sp.]|nr:GNAT family N-acetyltransferase [Candidatus Parabeggiatoa sp.]
MNAEWIIMSLDKKRHNRADFDCGEPALNEYLQKFASQNAAQDISRTFVMLSATHSQKTQKILGFYTLTVGQINFESLPVNCIKKIPRYPIPIARLARLAIDQSLQGQHLGQKLLMDALRRCARISNDIGLFGIIVDAKHDKAKKFYQKYGFVEIQDEPLTLFIRMSTVFKMLAALVV